VGRESAAEFHNETSKRRFILIMDTFEASDMLSACTYQRFAFEYGGVTVSIGNWGRARRVNGI
jgi:hypothetical protein